MNIYKEKFTVEFKPLDLNNVTILLNGNKVGNDLNDNSYFKDGYRFHDVMHFSFAAYLGWSPCLESILNKQKLKATQLEECLSLLLFTMYKDNHYQFNTYSFEKFVMPIIEISNIEIKCRNQWELASKQGLDMFKKLIDFNGGKVEFNPKTKTACYIPT